MVARAVSIRSYASWLQIFDWQAAQSSRLAEHLSLVHDAMTFCKVQGDAMSAADIQKLTELLHAQSKAEGVVPHRCMQCMLARDFL